MNTHYNYSDNTSQLKKKQEAKQRGIDGEQRAVDYLISKNYKILHRNWRTKLGEIDIIAQIDDIIVFVEIKIAVFLKGYKTIKFLNANQFTMI